MKDPRKGEEREDKHDFYRRMLGVDVEDLETKFESTGLGEKKQPPPTPPRRGMQLRQRPLPTPPSDSTEEKAFRQALGVAKGLLDRATEIVPATPAQTKLRVLYEQAAHQLGEAAERRDFATANEALKAALAAARQLILRAQLDVSVPRKQLTAQTNQYEEMQPILESVVRTYFKKGAVGSSQRLAKEKLAPGKEFKAYMKALEVFETAKEGVEPGAVDAETLHELRQRCDAVAETAQAYLDHFARDLDKRQRTQTQSRRKFQICTEGLKSARHYAMALALEQIGAPSEDKPWDRATETRIAQLRAKMSFETGYSKGSSLKETGGGGGSIAYWVESKELGSTKPEKNFIFKPTEGERTPLDDEPGAGAAKEALASANAKLFERLTGIDLGVPETQVVSIGNYALNTGDDAPPGGSSVGSLQQFESSEGGLKLQPPRVHKQIPPGEIQKIALIDIMSLNMDRHGGNVLLKPDPLGGPPKLIPIDHGCTLPKPNDFKSRPELFAGCSHWGVSQNQTVTTPSAYEKFPHDMLEKLELLDPEAIYDGMKQQLDTLDQLHPGLDSKQKVPDESLQQSKRALMFLKKAAHELSPAEIQFALAQNYDEIFASSNEDFDAAVERVIAAAKPKGAAYKALFTDDLAKIRTTLKANGWEKSEQIISKDPETALKLYQSGLKGTPGVDPKNAANGIDMNAALLRYAGELLDEVAAILGETEPEEHDALAGRYQILTDAPRTTPEEIAELETKCKELRDDVRDSCLEAIWTEATAVHNGHVDTIAKPSDRRAYTQWYEATLEAISSKDIARAKNGLGELKQRAAGEIGE